MNGPTVTDALIPAPDGRFAVCLAHAAEDWTIGGLITSQEGAFSWARDQLALREQIIAARLAAPAPASSGGWLAAPTASPVAL